MKDHLIAFMWILIACAALASLMIGLSGCGPQAAEPIKGGCTKEGICCYVWVQSQFSCVATKIQIIVSPGEIKDERDGTVSWNGGVPGTLQAPFQGTSQAGGEVQSRAIEARILSQFDGGRTQP